jgi:hypothetical protein
LRGVALRIDRKEVPLPSLRLVSPEPPNVIEADAGLVAYRRHAHGYTVFVGRHTSLGPVWPEVHETAVVRDAMVFTGVRDWERFLNGLEAADHELYCEFAAQGWQPAVARISVDFDAMIARD